MGTIGVEIKQPPMSTPFTYFTEITYSRPMSNIYQIMAPPAPPNSRTSVLQHVERPEKYKINKLDQTSQNIKISSKKSINDKISILQCLNIKLKIVKLGLMGPRKCTKNHLTKPLIQAYYTNGRPVNYGPDWYTEHTEAASMHRTHT